jgi:hypothetical protein
MPAQESDQAYFIRRARDCRIRAEQSADPAVQQIHLMFATAYEQRARAEAGIPAQTLSAH